jgi:hypothetical protein
MRAEGALLHWSTLKLGSAQNKAERWGWRKDQDKHISKVAVLYKILYKMLKQKAKQHNLNMKNVEKHSSC